MIRPMVYNSYQTAIKQRDKELDLCLKEQKYIKSSFLTINNPSMSSTHRSSGNGNGLNLRGVETTR